MWGPMVILREGAFCYERDIPVHVLHMDTPPVDGRSTRPRSARQWASYGLYGVSS